MLKITKSKRTKLKSRTKSRSRTKSKPRTKSKSKKLISKKLKSRTNLKNKTIPKVGNKVKIAIKPYKGKTAIGKVKRVLTKKKYHSRGHKVMLNSDEVGRVLEILQLLKCNKDKLIFIT